MYVSSVLSSNIGLYEHLLQWAFYAEERRKSREDVDVFISLLRKSRDKRSVIGIAMEPLLVE